MNRTLAGLFAIACLVLGAATTTRAQEHGHCIRADVERPIVLPDGARYPAGALRICTSRLHSPTIVLHETRIDGRNVGLYASATALNEESLPGAEPYLVFERDAAGDLVLQGYAVPEGDRMRTFLMAQPDRIHPDRSSR